ncbi:MAG: ferrochelatase [Leptospiraceae bacterium]|nr:ferrochelatase [Leptospiraceae bacterium]
MLQHLGKEGYKRIAIFPISFVSDHLETLERNRRSIKRNCTSKWS